MLQDCDLYMPLVNKNIPAGIGDYFLQWKEPSGRLNLDVSP